MTASEVISKSHEHGPTSLIRRIVWDTGVGFARMLEEKEILPTELFGHFELLLE